MGRRIEKVENHNIAVTTAAISTLPYWNQGGGLSKLVINLNNNIALKQQQHVRILNEHISSLTSSG